MRTYGRVSWDGWEDMHGDEPIRGWARTQEPRRLLSSKMIVKMEGRRDNRARTGNESLTGFAGRRGSWRAARQDVLDARVLYHDVCRREEIILDGDDLYLEADDGAAETERTNLLALSFARSSVMGKMAYCCWLHGTKLLSRELRDDGMERSLKRISIPSYHQTRCCTNRSSIMICCAEENDGEKVLGIGGGCGQTGPGV